MCICHVYIHKGNTWGDPAVWQGIENKLKMSAMFLLTIFIFITFSPSPQLGYYLRVTCNDDEV
jgi:hypothetical protein